MSAIFRRNKHKTDPKPPAAKPHVSAQCLDQGKAMGNIFNNGLAVKLESMCAVTMDNWMSTPEAEEVFQTSELARTGKATLKDDSKVPLGLREVEAAVLEAYKLFWPMFEVSFDSDINDVGRILQPWVTFLEERSRVHAGHFLPTPTFKSAIKIKQWTRATAETGPITLHWDLELTLNDHAPIICPGMTEFDPAKGPLMDKVTVSLPVSISDNVLTQRSFGDAASMISSELGERPLTVAETIRLLGSLLTEAEQKKLDAASSQASQ